MTTPHTPEPVEPGCTVPRELLRAISDPGSLLPRQDGYGIDGDEFESLWHWQARAVLASGFVAGRGAADGTP